MATMTANETKIAAIIKPLLEKSNGFLKAIEFGSSPVRVGAGVAGGACGNGFSSSMKVNLEFSTTYYSIATYFVTVIVSTKLLTVFSLSVTSRRT